MSENRKLTAAMFIGVRGEGIISFGSGQPDLPPPKEVYDILPDYNGFKYGLIQGQENLRDALAKQYPRSTADSFVITNGASEALDLSLRAIAWLQKKKGGGKPKCLLCRPYYYSYLPLVEYRRVRAGFHRPQEGRIVYEDFERKIKDCKAVLINSPSNPTGRVEAIETLREDRKDHGGVRRLCPVRRGLQGPDLCPGKLSDQGAACGHHQFIFQRPLP